MNDYFYSILLGARLTIAVSLGALAVSIFFGFAGALAKMSGNRLLTGIAATYTTVIRGVPELVLMLLVFYGGSIAINTLLEAAGSSATLDINAFAAGVITLGFIYGAYMTETFRGAMLAIPQGQAEAAYAYGMRPKQVFLRITLPQMVRYALPGFTNNWLVLIKATALVSLLGLQDMTYLAKQASAATRSSFMYFLFTAALYLLFTWASLVALRWLNARYSLGVRRVGA
jgi:arginine/ornithine transport system permease protein